jgi:hypothetical protein
MSTLSPGADDRPDIRKHAIYVSADNAHVREIWWGLTAAALKCMSTRRRSSV